MTGLLGTIPTLVKLPDAEFNAESIGANLKSQKWKTKKAACLFPIALFNFETNLIKWRFSLFSGPFWTVLPTRYEAENLPVQAKKMFFLSNLVPRVPFFYIQKKSRLKNRDTTHQLWEVSIDIQKKIIDSFTLVYIRLYSSTFVQAHLVALLHSSTFVHALLYSSRLV